MSVKRIFVDTNIIIEASRINCWSALSSRNHIVTVEKCIEEALTGKTPVHKSFVDNIAARHMPTKIDILNVGSILQENRLIIDDGELHLFSFLHANKNTTDNIMISTADRAAVRAAFVLGWIDHMYSLEEILNVCGVTNTQISSLKLHFKKSWLVDLKTQFILSSLSTA